ncbi:hypothetical protein O1611_g2912 [Lasiodiplodia mahajangana]|uniref:Uncharacterized protein n=1 Tax=Lasiodiplodia mahajangana TaxID=1108764 RepID=A0ACC2JT76_9PEZI|nr:hypothetical protein O1611_g2912 [Lasiodiplodia mahajangana]
MRHYVRHDPCMGPGSTDDDTDNTDLIDFSYSNYNINLPCIDGQDAFFFGNDPGIPFPGLLPPADQNFAANSLFSPSAILPPVSTEFFYYNTQLDVSGVLGNFPDNLGSTAPTYSVSSLPPRPGRTPPTATSPAPWSPPLAPPTAIASPENKGPSSSYQCLRCPTRLTGARQPGSTVAAALLTIDPVKTTTSGISSLAMQRLSIPMPAYVAENIGLKMSILNMLNIAGVVAVAAVNNRLLPSWVCGR